VNKACDIRDRLILGSNTYCDRDAPQSRRNEIQRDTTAWKIIPVCEITDDCSDQTAEKRVGRMVSILFSDTRESVSPLTSGTVQGEGKRK
jgi:hypothetical protein